MQDNDPNNPHHQATEPASLDSQEPGSGQGFSRGQLVWNVLVFQLKLLADGMRDVLLSPLSLGSALYGLVAGGSQPDQYFRRVLLWGRRTERWINLFGHHRGKDTADAMIEPLKTKTFKEAQNNPVVKRLSADLNAQLDRINLEAAKRNAGKRAKAGDEQGEND